MGACLGKAGEVHANGVDKDQRGASVLDAERAGGNSKAEIREGAGNAISGATALLGLFPKAHRRAALCGLAAHDSQAGFADKPCARGGEESLGALRIGACCKKGLKPESPNQDDFCVLSADGVSLLGVFDGHGPYGHDLASFVQEALLRAFVHHPQFQDDPARALTDAFPIVQRLCTESQTDGRFDCSLSGTTATLAMHRDGLLYLAHVGDSRTVLARREGDVLRSQDLTVDHKPSCEAEKQRILAAGGQIRRLEGDVPFRVFLAGKMFPGLSMTRSIGDTVGATAGVSSTPEVAVVAVQPDWRFLLLCSDGVWEFITSQEAVDIVSRFAPSDVQQAVENLASEAWNRWLREEEGMVDDITVLCIWLRDD